MPLLLRDEKPPSGRKLAPGGKLGADWRKLMCDAREDEPVPIRDAGMDALFARSAFACSCASHVPNHEHALVEIYLVYNTSN